MLLIRSSIRSSVIHGLGCFTDEPIKRGQIVWAYDERLDVRISESELPKLPEPVQEFLNMYGYTELVEGGRVIVLCGDHARHMNHSDTPNVLEVGDSNEYNVAARDIVAGEELTCNYFDFDLDANKKLVKSA